MDNSVFLSIIIPVYNLEKYICRTIECLLPQLKPDIEVIIVNDGSTDGSLVEIEKITDGYKENFSVVSYKNSGVSSARNKGIKLAKGKYIYFLDGDDLVSYDLVEKIRDRDEFDYLIFGFDTVDENRNVLTSFQSKYIYPNETKKPSLILRDFLLKNFTICIGSSVFKRQIIIENALMFDEKYAYGEDVTFFAKYMAHAKNVQVIKKSLMFYVIHENSAMGRLQDTNYTAVWAIQEMYEYLLQNGIENKIARICYSCMIPGSILAQNIRAAGNGKKYTKSQLSDEIRNLLGRINIWDCLILKRKRGLSLYIGSKLLYIAPPIFYFFVNILGVYKRGR